MLRFLDRGLTALCVAGVVLLVGLLVVGPGLVGAKTKTANGGGAGGTATSGAQVFASSGCGSCHTLKAAGAGGMIGPNLDQLKPNAAAVAAIVRSGGGSMPEFATKLSYQQIIAVASYVSSVAGR